MPRKYMPCAFCKKAYLESEGHACEGYYVQGNTVVNVKPEEGITIPHPKTTNHYNGKVEPIDLIEAQGLGFHEGNIVKYICRYDRKGGMEDLLKAQDYLGRLVRLREETQADSGR